MKAVVTAEVELEIPFFDVDSMGITWHGNYLRYFEVARCKLLDKIDYGYRQMLSSGYGWPIVDVQLKYVKSSTFEQKIRVVAGLVEWENRLKIQYQIFDAGSGERLTKGYTIQAAVNMQTKELCFETPAVFRQRLQPFLEAQ
ncbi:acyl-CoA thioesterase [Shewanella yunxiaonensis]|uniref:Acyl-CoA thioesterase n=1 Tax=Shewanella yunxiaonensis TaxID=2829809 RepID=A0ABX7YTQ0_9GAMM|nr:MULTISPECIES: acyl-CoA thioesterase [Shewanella]MDF0533327.1 acyl-CoA thioesterase [Shewanella sp. A32]QUN05716.1 acyl-CoA thioesterase [Shewanella yunxiaonensis]